MTEVLLWLVIGLGVALIWALHRLSDLEGITDRTAQILAYVVAKQNIEIPGITDSIDKD